LSELLEEEGNAVFATGQDGAARGFQNARAVDFRGADFVVNGHGFSGVAVGQRSFGAEDAAFGDGVAEGGGCVRERVAQRFHRGVVADLSERHRGGRGHQGIRVLQPVGQQLDRRRVAAHADGVDHADQEPPLQ
jgi:hypothetical protein